MALPVSQHPEPGVGTLPKPLDADAALAAADRFLIMEVGDLLGAESPQLAPNGLWVMTITLSNASQGLLGEVGTIAVDAASGAILFPEEERARVKARAEELTRRSAL